MSGQEGALSTPSEARTRKELIDPALARAGWDVNDPARVRVEIPVDGFDPAAWQALSARLKGTGEAGPAYDLPAGVSDYALYRPNGEIIAVVEAKRTIARLHGKSGDSRDRQRRRLGPDDQ
jgi:type I site-specific restriction endonuclease